MDEGPDCGGQCVRVGWRKGPLDDCTDVKRDGFGSRRTFVVIAIARFSKHDAKQGGSLEGKLDIGDGNGCELLRG